MQRLEPSADRRSSSGRNARRLRDGGDADQAARLREGKRYPTMCFTYSGPHAPQVRNRWGGALRCGTRCWRSRATSCGSATTARPAARARVAQACYRDMGTSELRDLEDGVDWLVDKGFADPERVGIWGWSYGGYQTAFCLTHSKSWKLGIAVNPVTDWRFYDTIYTERYMGCRRPTPRATSARVCRGRRTCTASCCWCTRRWTTTCTCRTACSSCTRSRQRGSSSTSWSIPGCATAIADDAQQRHLFRDDGGLHRRAPLSRRAAAMGGWPAGAVRGRRCADEGSGRRDERARG